MQRKCIVLTRSLKSPLCSSLFESITYSMLWIIVMKIKRIGSYLAHTTHRCWQCWQKKDMSTVSPHQQAIIT